MSNRHAIVTQAAAQYGDGMDSSHVIVLPGGGYTMLSDNEAEVVAERLRSFGLSASVFDYPVQTRHPGPLDAVRSEVRRVRAAGAARVALLGFSAGGHLAGQAALAPSGEPAERVDAAVLGYPVVSMGTGDTSGFAGRTPRARRRERAPRLDLPGPPRHVRCAAVLHLAHRGG